MGEELARARVLLDEERYLQKAAIDLQHHQLVGIDVVEKVCRGGGDLMRERGVDEARLIEGDAARREPVFAVLQRAPPTPSGT